MMNIFIGNGADTEFTEPDRTVVSKADILAWCALSHEQLDLQSEFDHAFCRVSGDTYEYPLYATRSQVEVYRRTRGKPSLKDQWGLDTEESDSWESSSFSADSSGRHNSE